MTNRLLALAIFFLAIPTFANPNKILTCNGNSPHFPDSYFELFIDNNGKLASAYTMGLAPVYYPSWTTAGRVTTPPKKFVDWMNEINNFQHTGIDPLSVKYLQNIFIDGNDRFSVEIWKLMDERKKLIGWVAHAYGEVIGCYTN